MDAWARPLNPFRHTTGLMCDVSVAVGPPTDSPTLPFVLILPRRFPVPSAWPAEDKQAGRIGLLDSSISLATDFLFPLIMEYLECTDSANLEYYSFFVACTAYRHYRNLPDFYFP